MSSIARAPCSPARFRPRSRPRPAIAFLLVAAGLGAGTAPAAAQDEQIVRQLSFRGNRALDDLTLEAAIETTNSSAFATWPLLKELGLGTKRRFDQRRLERDVERLRLIYRISGYLEVAVDTVIRRTESDVYLTFQIREGPPVILTRFEVRGFDSLADTRNLLRDLPLQVGDPFNRSLLGVTRDTLALRLMDRGYPQVQVFLAERLVDSAGRSAEVRLEVRPGPAMPFGSIAVEGAEDTGDSLKVLRFLAAETGRPFRQVDLLQSQRNMALSGLYRFASVDIDSVRFDSAATAVPLLVRLVPGPRGRVGASAGYGTEDCFRGSVGWSGRDVLGRGRIADASIRVSKLGVGDPLDFGLQSRFLCQRLADDSVGSRDLNYNAGVSIREPGLFGPRTSLALGLFAEQASEFKVYSRQAYGGTVSFTTETPGGVPLSFGYRVSWGQTDAEDVNFCAYFNACTPADIEILRARQRMGAVSLGVSRLRVNNLLDPTRGMAASFQVTHSGAVTGSQELQRFTRVSGDFSAYTSVSRQVVLATRVRAGMLFSPVEFSFPGSSTPVRYVPPDQRFYAGGPNDVRGFDGNQLGPVVYVVFDTVAVNPDTLDPGSVRVSPIGGNRVLVGNAELRLPSPIFPSFTRAVAFVDVGAVWEEREGRSTPVRFRVTPGVGIRFETPLGPARFDLGYNPYDLPEGDLYQSLPNGDLRLLSRTYRKPRTSKFTVHFAIGHAF